MSCPEELEMRWKLDEEEDCVARRKARCDSRVCMVCVKSKTIENALQMRTSSSCASATASSRFMRIGANGLAEGRLGAVPRPDKFASPLVPRLRTSRVRRGEETVGATKRAGATGLPARPRLLSDPGSEVRL